MNNWQKLSLPVALGLCAALLNWQSISRKLEPRSYVAVKETVEPGQKFSLDSFHAVLISHTGNNSLAQTLVPWDKVSALVGQYSQRRLGKDSLLTQFDLFESNVVHKLNTETAVEIQLPAEDRLTLPVFVSDLVDLQYGGKAFLTKCRVLSIDRREKNYCVRVAVDSAQYDAFASRYGTDMLVKLQLTEHTVPATASK